MNAKIKLLFRWHPIRTMTKDSSGSASCLYLVSKGPCHQVKFHYWWIIYLSIQVSEGGVKQIVSPDTMRVTVERRSSPHWRLFEVIFLLFTFHCRQLVNVIFSDSHFLTVSMTLLSNINFFTFYFLAIFVPMNCSLLNKFLVFHIHRVILVERSDNSHIPIFSSHFISRNFLTSPPNTSSFNFLK